MYVNSRQNSVKQRSEPFDWNVVLCIFRRILLIAIGAGLAYFCWLWCVCWRIFSFGGILCVFLPFAWCISIYWDGLLGGMAGVVGLGWRICCPGILDNVYVSWDCVVVVLHDNLRMCSLRYVFYSQAISYYVLWRKKCAGIKLQVWLTHCNILQGIIIFTMVIW